MINTDNKHMVVLRETEEVYDKLRVSQETIYEIELKRRQLEEAYINNEPYESILMKSMETDKSIEKVLNIKH